MLHSRSTRASLEPAINNRGRADDAPCGDYYSTTALLLSGRLFHAIISAILWGLSIVISVFSLGIGSFISGPIWIIAVVHAVYLVHKERAEDRVRE